MFSCLPAPTAADVAPPKPRPKLAQRIRTPDVAVPRKSGSQARLSLREQIDLVNQCIADSQSACTDLHERFVGVVRARLIGGYGIPVDDVDDVVQAVFLKFFRDLALYNRTNPLTTFLYFKVREEAVGYWLRQERSREVLTETGDLPFGEGLTEAAKPYAFRALLEAVCSCGAKPHMILTMLFVHFLRYGYEDFVGDTELRGMPFSELVQVFRRHLRCGLPAEDRLWLDDCLVPLAERLVERTHRVYVEKEYVDLMCHPGDVLVGDLCLNLFFGSNPVGETYDWNDKVKRAARRTVSGELRTPRRVGRRIVPTAARRPRKRQKAPPSGAA